MTVAVMKAVGDALAYSQELARKKLRSTTTPFTNKADDQPQARERNK